MACWRCWLGTPSRLVGPGRDLSRGPTSPCCRLGTENTNGILGQYFPKGTDLSIHGPDELERVAHELNTRPRKTLDWDTPAERLAEPLDSGA
ncbi:hypothetical protein BFN03_04955 [Rhodococcus sp. WMMA185]|nr:hypothetical protein BFN03_04955 [Rhodococcus sp. WMMA185]